MTQEVVETEAIYHYMPGAPILSLGNIGCMMNCSFCHNWRTSQMKFVQPSDVRRYSPEQVVETALRKGTKILSWTYNDPVVWHEFVYDTAKLAKQHGLINLFKSAFYIGPEAVEELHDVIDIFSLSLKSMDPVFYRKVTKGHLEPVLEAIKQVHSWGDRHLEISNLVVTGMNDNLSDARKVSEWILGNLGSDVPLHYVRFHPDYRYTHVGRTSIPFLMEARQQAKEMGINHCYVGNVFAAGEHLNTYCRRCSAPLVERFGISSRVGNVSHDGTCACCGEASGLILNVSSAESGVGAADMDLPLAATHEWRDDINSVHTVFHNRGERSETVYIAEQGAETPRRAIPLAAGERWRVLVARTSAQSSGVIVHHSPAVEVTLLDVLDRAHFPADSQKSLAEVQEAS